MTLKYNTRETGDVTILDPDNRWEVLRFVVICSLVLVAARFR
jgi:hypothetical protein